MLKKIILGLVAVVAMVGGVAAMSAYEAHIINVTAHIENALNVHPEEIAFGTVFPQEYLERQFTVEMSESFIAAGRADDVEYVIKQKPKCECTEDGASGQLCVEGDHAPVDYATHECPDGFEQMESLCPYLSKTDADPTDGNDTSHLSYYVDPTPESPNSGDESCPEDVLSDATGYLSKLESDFVDLWVVDLKVPPVDGYVGQDWPAGCPTVAENDIDYGCDLWIEVTGISEVPQG